jgi:hypothetical protein
MLTWLPLFVFYPQMIWIYIVIDVDNQHVLLKQLIVKRKWGAIAINLHTIVPWWLSTQIILFVIMSKFSTKLKFQKNKILRRKINNILENSRILILFNIESSKVMT